MLELVRIQNFKCFEDISINLKPLTILCGRNGSGKSSFIQFLLLLRQSYEQNSLNKNLLLHGDYVHVGSKNDALNEAVENDWIKVTLKSSNMNSFSLKYGAQNDLDSLPFINYDFNQDVSNESLDIPLNKYVDNLSLFSENKFSYISAERFGPKLFLPKDDIQSHKNVGIYGEYIGHYLTKNKTHKITGLRLAKNIEETTLLNQVEGWLEDITPNIRIKLEDMPGIDQVQVRYQSVTKSGLSNEYRATNIGFGVSYSLPIVATLLKAEKDSLVIIDTPEAHLHPKAQTNIGELMARTAKDGAQVIVETHSDHIINSARLAIKQGIIKAEDLNIVYFSRGTNLEELITTVKELDIDKNGNIAEWPDGFLDEWNINLRKLLS